jgi:hypothetical protein
MSWLFTVPSIIKDVLYTLWQNGLLGYMTLPKSMALFFVVDRTAETLLALIKRCVLSGTMIHTDEWAGYSHVALIDVEPPFIHLTVNHSKHFVDPVTGVHTQSIKAYWSSVKQKLKTMNGASRQLTASCLDEHMYRQRHGPVP